VFSSFVETLAIQIHVFSSNQPPSSPESLNFICTEKICDLCSNLPTWFATINLNTKCTKFFH